MGFKTVGFAGGRRGEQHARLHTSLVRGVAGERQGAVEGVGCADGVVSFGVGVWIAKVVLGGRGDVRLRCLRFGGACDA
jgi:hypothetical protein